MGKSTGFAAIEQAALSAEVIGTFKDAKILAVCEDGEIYILSDVVASKLTARRVVNQNALIAWLLTRS
jgi:hypothetical protein